MRKNTTLFSAIAFLGLLIGACNPSATDETVSGGESKTDISDIKIAYIVTDSVINNFEYFKERSAEIAEKGNKYQSELTNRAKGFEQEVASFQSTGGNMTRNQAQAKQEELMKKEENLMTYRQNIMAELSADETALYNEVYDKIQVYLNDYAASNDLEMILSYTRGGGVWYAKKNFDVTDDVISGINADYKDKGNSSSSEEKVEEPAEEK
ncbi:OmpH family outer membrane protein [uncultured Cyclobacterium sp.]|uniref:OmpH family outer membrane protein n=1 Tax=uncultured Cyclobacterium sp. TaxID=453820 RepID=UPI0030EEE465